MVGFTYYARIMKIIAFCLACFCVGMLIDYYSSFQTGEERVQTVDKLPWSMTNPGMMVVRTEASSLVVMRGYRELLLPGRVMQMEKTRFSGIPVSVSFYHRGRLREISAHGGIYGDFFPLVFVLLVLTIATLYVKGNPEYNAYVGTVMVLVAVVVISIIFNV